MAKLKNLWNERGFLMSKTATVEVRASFDVEGQDVDSEEHIHRSLTALTWPCPTCGEKIGEHTQEKIRECARKAKFAEPPSAD